MATSYVQSFYSLKQKTIAFSSDTGTLSPAIDLFGKTMKTNVIFIFLFALTLLQYTYASNQEVTQSFNDYRTAILNADAHAAYNLVDSNTKKYYSEMLKAVLYANAEQSKAMPSLAKLFILQCRHRIPEDSLTSFNGESFFKYLVMNGWIGKNSVSGLEITDISINENTATSKIKKGDKIAPFGFKFKKEELAWKIDLTSIFSSIRCRT